MILKNTDQRDWCGVFYDFFTQNMLNDIGAVFTVKKTLREPQASKQECFFCSQMLFFVVLLVLSLITTDSFDSLSYYQIHAPINELLTELEV